MPRVATSDELDLLRSDGQASKWFCAFFNPHTIYSARLASVPSTTDQVAQITFTSGSGTLANVKADMTLWVGTSAGANDLGICRIRKAPIAGTFYIGEQSLVEWQSNCYLTVVDDYDLHAKHVRIDGTTIYIDYDLGFSDQHTTFSPVPVLGPIVRVVELVEGTGNVVVGPESGTASWVFGSSISSRLWSTPSSGIAFDNTALANPTITVTSAGWKLLYCTITAANGKTRQGVRYVYAWDADNPPLTVFQVSDFTEDEKQGGINFNLVFANDVSLTDIPDRSLCVLFEKAYYGIGDDQQQISIGAVTGAENVLGIGRTISESITYDDETKTTSIEIAGYQEMMKRIHGFPAGLRFKITPAAWTDMPALTVDRGLYHLLEYHTSAITIMDFIRTEDTRYTAQTFSAFSSIWEQMQQFAYKQILARSFVDSLGRLFFQIDPNYMPVADRDYPVVMTLTDNDLTGRVQLPRDYLHEFGQINASGVVVDGGGNGTAFFSLSPGHIQARTGGISVEDYLLLEDQTQANELAGLIFGAKNNPYKPMRAKLRANNHLLTVFPNQAISYQLTANKNPRGVAITKNWIPRQRKVTFDGTTGIVETEIILEAESEPVVAVTGDVPGSTSFSFPPFPSLPPLPSIPVFPGGVGGAGSVTDGGPPSVLVHSVTAGLLLCNNFDDGENEQEWYLWNSGLSAFEYQNIRNIVVCPNGAIYICSGHSIGNAAFVKRAPYAGGLFETVEDQASINAKVGASGNNGRVSVIQCNPLLSESVAYVLYNNSGGSTGYAYIGSGGSFVAGAVFGIADPNNTDISYGNGKWVATGNSFNAKLFRFDSGFTALEFTSSFPGFLQSGQTRHRRVSTTGRLLHWKGSGSSLAISEDNGASITTDIAAGYYIHDVTDVDAFGYMAMDPTGQYICTDRVTTRKGRSSDGGYTLNDITNLPSAGIYAYAYAGDTTRFIAVNSYLYYTDDFWNSSPMDKRGNILDLVPILNLTNVRVLEF